jgi:hypothetical protein
MNCDRPGCGNTTEGDLLYCSDGCFGLDNDPNPITVLARHKIGGFGNDLYRSYPEPVHIPREGESA